MSDGASPGARMSRRPLAVMAIVLASTSFTGCTESVTAPQRSTLAPTAPHLDALAGSRCKGGYILSEGRCG